MACFFKLLENFLDLFESKSLYHYIDEIIYIYVLIEQSNPKSVLTLKKKPNR